MLVGIMQILSYLPVFANFPLVHPSQEFQNIICNKEQDTPTPNLPSKITSIAC